ncbi:MAG: amidohydrolase [Deltaproteobacteria bacterium]|nr:amidohydrolase [Candidatus Zymogenaceae bacterium]
MIIDICVSPPLPEILTGYADPPQHLVRYKRLFKGSEKALAALGKLTVEDFLLMMDAAGIAICVLHGEDMESTFGRRINNELIVDLVHRYPTRFRGFIGVDPHKGRKATREIDRMVSEGLCGVMIAPWEHGLFTDDKKYFPIYERCLRHDIPIWIHTSLNFSHVIPMEYGRPLILDRVAVRYGDLKIIAGHAGWPWVTEMVAVLWRHDNVYADISGVRPKYMGMHNTGWEPLIHYGNTILQDKILFGTAWPLVMFDTAVNDVKELPLKPEVRGKWFYGNAARLLKIEG